MEGAEDMTEDNASTAQRARSAPDAIAELTVRAYQTALN